MATLIVMPAPRSRRARVAPPASCSMHRGPAGPPGAFARGDQRVDVGESVPGLDERHAVPLERLLDEKGTAEALVECARALVAGDDPDDQSVRAVRLLRAGDRR